MAHTRFALAVHALALIASGPERVTSSALADSARANATCLRRVLAPLARAGLVVSVEGRDGGYALMRPAKDITLADVYNAVAQEPLFQSEFSRARPGCPITMALGPTLAQIADDAEHRLTEALSQRTVADVAHQLSMSSPAR
jgi:Rrf2 family protein